MNFITQWWNDKFRKVDEDYTEAVGKAAFGSEGAGQRMLMIWMDKIVMNPPDTFDPDECIAWVSKHKMVTDIIKALDAAENPDKYRTEQAKPRHVIGGRVG